MSSVSSDVKVELGNTLPIQKQPRSRSWCLTFNNYCNDDVSRCQDVFVKNDFEYIIGKEVGESGTPHLQMFCRSDKYIVFNTIKNLFPTCHIEKARGSVLQNFKYCSKDKDYISNIICEKRNIIDDYNMSVIFGICMINPIHENVFGKDTGIKKIDCKYCMGKVMKNFVK